MYIFILHLIACTYLSRWIICIIDSFSRWIMLSLLRKMRALKLRTYLSKRKAVAEVIIGATNNGKSLWLLFVDQAITLYIAIVRRGFVGVYKDTTKEQSYACPNRYQEVNQMFMFNPLHYSFFFYCKNQLDSFQGEILTFMQIRINDMSQATIRIDAFIKSQKLNWSDIDLKWQKGIERKGRRQFTSITTKT